MVDSVTNTTTTPTSNTSSTAATDSAQDAATLSGNYTTFLSLLTAQIKNQDPLSPMDTTEWTNQLVQYSSVEQQLKANTYLEQIANSDTSGSMNSAVGYIGKTVSATQPTATLANGSATWDYNLGTQANATTLTIQDANGNTVWSNSGETGTGDHTLTWDGKDSAGNQLADGNYTLNVTSTTAAGQAVTTTVGVSGVVTSAQNASGVVTLQVGNTSVPITSVTSVS